jgi:lipid-A-disaccharide synthase
MLLLNQRHPGLRFVLPTVPHVADLVRTLVARWPVKPTIVVGETEKLAAFRRGRAAIAASGTVTLELALANVPMAVAYRVGYLEGEIARRLLTVSVASLPNLIVGETIVPEFIEWGWTGATLADAVSPLIEAGSARDAQLAGFQRVRDGLAVGRIDPSERAARIVLEHASRPRDPGVVGTTVRPVTL